VVFAATSAVILAIDVADLPRESESFPIPRTILYPRLGKKPNIKTQTFRTSFQATKRPKSKTSGGGTPPKGVFNPPDHLGESWACSEHGYNLSSSKIWLLRSL